MYDNLKIAFIPPINDPNMRFQPVIAPYDIPPIIYPPIIPPPPFDYRFPEDNVYLWNIPRVSLDLSVLDKEDIDKIVRNGDVSAVEYYVERLINGDITSHGDNFGTLGAQRAFKTLQLACSYLYHLRNRRFVPFCATPTQYGDSFIRDQNDALISSVGNQLRDYGDMIRQLQIQNSRERRELLGLRVKRKKIEEQLGKIKKAEIREYIKQRRKYLKEQAKIKEKKLKKQEKSKKVLAKPTSKYVEGKISEGEFVSGKAQVLKISMDI